MTIELTHGQRRAWTRSACKSLDPQTVEKGFKEPEQSSYCSCLDVSVGFNPDWMTSSSHSEAARKEIGVCKAPDMVPNLRVRTP